MNDPAQFRRNLATSTLRVTRMVFLAYLAFVVYGSLVPLDFRPLPMAEALERFRQVPYLQLGIGSRADWVANLLLFIPLTFLAMAALDHDRPRPGLRPGTAIGVILAAWALSLGIEFTQLFFPPRTVSQNDILAEGLGAVLGVLAWWRWGGRVVAWLARWRDLRGPVNIAEQILWTWLAVLFAYNLLPLDLTISPVEVYHKWQEGRLNLVPLAASPDAWPRLVYDLVTDMLIWVPVAALWVLSGRATPRRAWWLTVAAAVLLEGLQLLVYSRFSDTTDILTAALGAWAGVYLARRVRHTASRLAPAPGMAKVLFVVWLAVLAVIYWYPFEVSLQPGQFRERLGMFLHVPFHALYFGSEFNAATELLHKVLTFAPLGIFAAWASGTRARGAMPLALLLPPLLIEFGQVALPGKYPDSTDLLLEWLGGLLGYLGTRYVLARWRDGAAQPATGMPVTEPITEPVPARATTPVRDKAAPATPTDPARWFYLAGQLVLVAVLMLSAHVDAVPYNVRELMQALPLPLAATAIALALNILFVGPGLAGARLINGRRRQLWRVPLGLLGLTVVLYVLLRLAVPLESLHDVVGSPVLQGIDELELLGRFSALAMLAFIVLAGGTAAWCALRAARPGVFQRWLWLALPLVVICHWVIVTQAATDNLTELMRGGGSLLATALFALWLWLLAVTASLTTAAAAGRIGLLPPVLALALSAPAGYLLITLATASHIEKYGQTFSALQFLLSPDRQHLLYGDALLWRYGALHLALVLIMALALYPLWSRLGLRPAHWRPLRGAMR